MLQSQIPLIRLSRYFEAVDDRNFALWLNFNKIRLLVGERQAQGPASSFAIYADNCPIGSLPAGTARRTSQMQGVTRDKEPAVFTVVSTVWNFLTAKLRNSAERLTTETPNIRDAMQASENERKNSFLNYEFPALTAELQAPVVARFEQWKTVLP
jgi:hypothetical protein